MKSAVLHEAFLRIDDGLVSEAEYGRFNAKRKTLSLVTRISAVAACAAIIIASIAAIRTGKSPIGSSADDPHWLEWHVITDSPQEALTIFGDELLINGFSSTETNIRYLQFSLELPEDRSGSVADRSTWVSFSEWADFGKNKGNMSLDAYFDNNDERHTAFIESLKQEDGREIRIQDIDIRYTVVYSPVYENSPAVLLATFNYKGTCFDFVYQYAVQRNALSAEQREAEINKGLSVIADILERG